MTTTGRTVVINEVHDHEHEQAPLIQTKVNKDVLYEIAMVCARWQTGQMQSRSAMAVISDIINTEVKNENITGPSTTDGNTG